MWDCPVQKIEVGILTCSLLYSTKVLGMYTNRVLEMACFALYLICLDFLKFLKSSQMKIMSWLYLYCCCSVSKSSLTLCNPMNCSTPGFPVLHYLPEFAHSCALSRWCHPTVSSSVATFSSCPQSLPASGSFPMSQLFTSGGQSIGASASPSVLPTNIQGWFPLGLTGLISLLSKGLSRIFSSTKDWKHQFFHAQPSS